MEQMLGLWTVIMRKKRYSREFGVWYTWEECVGVILIALIGIASVAGIGVMIK